VRALPVLDQGQFAAAVVVDAGRPRVAADGGDAAEDVAPEPGSGPASTVQTGGVRTGQAWPVASGSGGAGWVLAGALRAGWACAGSA
jgi:hypothetical protein